MTCNGPRSARRVRWTPRLLLLVLLLLPLFTGCKGWDTPFNNANPDDPFLPGGAIPKPNNPPPQPPAPTGPVQPVIPPPTVPTAWGAPQSGATPAGLTTGGLRPVDTNTDPRFTATGAPADANGGWKEATTGATGNAPLRVPEATPVGVGNAIPAPGGTGVTQVGGIQSAGSLDQAYSFLESCGMTYNDLKQDGSNSTNYVFECSIPSKQKPEISDYYEGKGGSRLAAMQNVINQIQQKQAGK